MNAAPIRTLLVDDEPDIREVMRLVIEVDGDDLCVVGEAEDGLEAVAAVDDLSPEVVVIDVRMPHLDGMEAAAQILERRPQPSVIMCTAYVDRDLERRAHEIGVSAMVPKTEIVDIPTVIRRVAPPQS